jgi:hypothetical protein
MLYDNIDLPCLNRSYICTHAQFVREFRPIYPEIDYNVKLKNKNYIDYKRILYNILNR